MKKILCILLSLIFLVSCNISYQSKMCEGCPVTYTVMEDIEEDKILLEKENEKNIVKIYLNDIDSMYEISTFSMKIENSHLYVYLCKFEVSKTGSTYDLLITIELKDKKYDNIETLSFSWKEENN